MAVTVFRREPVVLSLGTGRMRMTYDTLMILLASTVVGLLFTADVGWALVVNTVIWGVFVADYFTRLALSTDRRAFVRANMVDLLAILPADQFRALRFLRVLRAVRAASVLARVTRDLKGIRDTNGLGWVLLVAVGVISASAVAVRHFEDGVTSWVDAFWWATVTATTVGYGDISPESNGARVVAVVLMLVGIGTIGMLTASIATYFLGGAQKSSSPHVQHVRDVLMDWESLSHDDRQAAASLLQALADRTADSVRPYPDESKGL